MPIELPYLNGRSAQCLNNRFFLVNMKAVVGTFNKEKAALSRHCETSRRFVDSSSAHCHHCLDSLDTGLHPSICLVLSHMSHGGSW